MDGGRGESGAGIGSSVGVTFAGKRVKKSFRISAEDGLGLGVATSRRREWELGSN